MISSLTGADSGTSSRTIATLLATLTERAEKSEESKKTGAAEAPPPPPPGPPPAASGLETGDASAESLFSALVANDDADGDGLISADELAASPVGDLLSAKFDSIDADGDGLISETEMTAAEAASRPAAPAEADRTTTAVSSAYETLLQALSSTESTAAAPIASDLAQRFMDALKALA